MKIFNWVHRRFHHKDGFGRYANKGECIENESETQALLKNVVLADVINGWNEGILTIGTFGFDPKTENPPFISIINKENEQDYEDSAEEEGELNPLVVNNDDKFESHCDDENDQQGDLIMTIDGNVLCPYNKMEKGERITLADLFSADSDTNKIAIPEDIGKLRPDSIKKPSPNSKDGVSFTKKVKIPLLGDDPHLIQKIQRLMKRMKKRKIHPELEGKLEKKEGTTTTTTTTTTPTVLACFKNHHGLNESASLLQTRDSMVCA